MTVIDVPANQSDGTQQQLPVPRCGLVLVHCRKAPKQRRWRLAGQAGMGALL